MERLCAAMLASTLLVACHRSFNCEDDVECGAAGTCEANGFCSFPSAGCPSGRRFGEHAAKGLVGACVPVDADPSTVADTGTSASEDPTTATLTTVTTATSTSTDATSGPASDLGDANPCNGLVEVGPIVATENDQVIAGLRIVAADGPAVLVDNFTGVTIRDSEIHHADGPGIRFSAADGIRIENVVIIHDAAPDEGSYDDPYQTSIEGRFSDDVAIMRVRAHDGSSGVDLEGTPGAMLSSIEVHDVRGPGVAACIRLAASDDAVLSDFECTNDLVVARPFHVVEIERSSNVEVREGLLDGSNSEYGYGVHFTQVNGQHSGGLVEDVDAIRMTNGSFSCFPHGDDITFSRTRAKQNICEIVSIPIEGCDMPGPNDGCIPGSGGITWSSSLDSSGIVILDSIYEALCGDPVWPDTNVTVADGDLVEMPFELRARLDLSYCWE